jgi:hypothetical protein
VAGVYSTRFILCSGFGLYGYTVPIGRRAVVKQVSVYNNSGAPQVVSFLVAGTTVWSASVPGTYGSSSTALFAVVNTSEKMELYLGAATMAGIVSGYLLDAT